MKQIALHQAGETDVALQGPDGKEYVYKARAMTKSLAEKLADDQQDIVKAMTDTDTGVDDVVKAEAKQLDTILHSPKRGVPKPSTLIVKLWDAEQITRQDVPRIVQEVVAAATGPR
jgi:hypothetical protein